MAADWVFMQFLKHRTFLRTGKRIDPAFTIGRLLKELFTYRIAQCLCTGDGSDYIFNYLFCLRKHTLLHRTGSFDRRRAVVHFLSAA